MVRNVDAILEGVRPDELVSLRQLAAGMLPVRRDAFAPLEAKGWVDMAQDVPLITLTGRALLDRSA